MNWKGTDVVVVGAGRSGVAAARLLSYLGARVTLTDARPQDSLGHLTTLQSPDVRLALGGHGDALWETARIAVVSPGISPQAPVLQAALRAGVALTGEIEVAAALADAPVVAITGSNGKSTVTSMVGAILSRAGFATAVCGNIGVPFCQVVHEVLCGRRGVDRYVLELSSFQTESIADFRPRWAAVLNLSPDHLDRHHDLATYAAAKLRICRNCGVDDWLVYGADDAYLASLLPRGPRTVPFGLGATSARPAAWVQEGAVFWAPEDGEPELVTRGVDLRVVGAHNLLNAAAAAALACLAGATPAAARAALADYEGLEHRMEPCGEVGGVRCVNDSKATNVGATAAALSGLESPVWLILGGRDKDSDFSRLRPLMTGVRRVLLIGEAAGTIAAALDGAVPLCHCRDLPNALETALQGASAGEIVLLAPACTSFDQYDDFEHRGRHFRQLVARRAAAVTPLS